jgi:hypothetical protein
MDAIESHYRSAFSDDSPKVKVPNAWWDGLPKLTESEKETLESPFTLNCYTKVLFNKMSLG